MQVVNQSCRKTIPYIRVGTTFYNLVKAPKIAWHFDELLVPWNKRIIKQDQNRASEIVFN